jgi:hypothetical protein
LKGIDDSHIPRHDHQDTVVLDLKRMGSKLCFVFFGLLEFVPNFADFQPFARDAFAFLFASELKVLELNGQSEICPNWTLWCSSASIT